MCTHIIYIYIYRERERVYYGYMAVAKTTSVLREAMLLVCIEPRSKTCNMVHRRVCGHMLKPYCTFNMDSIDWILLL